MITLLAQRQRLMWLISEADKFEADQMELRAHWARYLCVLSSGFLENALKDIYGRYVRARCDPAIANYVERTLSQVRNPKSSKFVETAKSFNQEWEWELEDLLNSDGNREALDAIISNRNLIAHGQNSNITLAQIKTYVAKCERVIELIEQQCGVAGLRS